MAEVNDESKVKNPGHAGGWHVPLDAASALPGQTATLPRGADHPYRDSRTAGVHYSLISCPGSRVLCQVELSCSVQYKEGLLQWTKDGFGLGVNRDLPGYPSYTMGGQVRTKPDHPVTLVIRTPSETGP